MKKIKCINISLVVILTVLTCIAIYIVPKLEDNYAKQLTYGKAIYIQAKEIEEK